MLAFAALAQIGAGAIFDLGDYVMDTGSYNTTGYAGDYGITFFATGTGVSQALISEDADIYYNETSMIRRGFKRVQKPYPGYLKLHNTSNVDYRYRLDSGQIFVLYIAGYDEALKLLPQITLISQADYQEKMYGKMEDALA